ncbi:hypothetical protein D9758_015708 [Tetrapyrgos nigripes]|uniref:Uncharacterized protein n=1 Tax=Tetrapyrgos nigripes TaxID=182062 RepID=A0A8H5C9X2_9AGAR|nr:hypothetical protein D9758_015708 [Tetrapyrgos nigripes]
MVKFFLVLAALALVVASPIGKRTVPQVEADLRNIATQVTTLDNSIKAFPNTGGTLVQALAIHTSAANLVPTIKSATTDIQVHFFFNLLLLTDTETDDNIGFFFPLQGTTGITEADGQTVLAIVNGIEPIIIDALNLIITKKAAFDALPLGGVSALVKQDLAQLAPAAQALEVALINLLPADLKAQATAIQIVVNGACGNAQAAYASA